MRQRVCPGQESRPEQFRLGDDEQRDLNRHAERLGLAKAAIIRKIVVRWIREQNRHHRKLAVAKRAKKGAQKSFPIRVAANRKRR